MGGGGGGLGMGTGSGGMSGTPYVQIWTSVMSAFEHAKNRHTLPGPDYFDEEAKCYGRLF